MCVTANYLVSKGHIDTVYVFTFNFIFQTADVHLQNITVLLSFRIMVFTVDTGISKYVFTTLESLP